MKHTKVKKMKPAKVKKQSSPGRGKEGIEGGRNYSYLHAG